MRHTRAVAILCGAALLGSCDRNRPEGVNAPGLTASGAVVEVEPVEPARIFAGQTVYVPVYSSVSTSDPARTFNLAVTLSVRNTDRTDPIVVNAVTYHGQGGEAVRDYLKKPVRLGPLASVNYLVAEGDTRGGVSACFLVDWVAEVGGVSAPLVEAVMAGTSSGQGISFVCPGRVVDVRRIPAR